MHAAFFLFLVSFVILGAGALASDVEVVPLVGEQWQFSEPIELEQLGASLQWVHDNEMLHLRLTGEPVGWMSIGFVRQGGAMDGANMLIARNIRGTWTVENHVGIRFNHRAVDWPPLASYEVETDGDSVTVLMSYPLNFASGFGLPGLEPGQTYTLIVALSNRSGLLNHGRGLRDSFAFSLEKGAEE